MEAGRSVAKQAKISSPVAKKPKMAGMPMGSAEVRDVVKKLCAKEALTGASGREAYHTAREAQSHGERVRAQRARARERARESERPACGGTYRR